MTGKLIAILTHCMFFHFGSCCSWAVGYKAGATRGDPCCQQCRGAQGRGGQEGWYHSPAPGQGQQPTGLS